MFLMSFVSDRHKERPIRSEISKLPANLNVERPFKSEYISLENSPSFFS